MSTTLARPSLTVPLVATAAEISDERRCNRVELVAFGNLTLPWLLNQRGDRNPRVLHISDLRNVWNFPGENCQEWNGEFTLKTNKKIQVVVFQSELPLGRFAT